MEVPESTQRHTHVRLKQTELVLFTLYDRSFVFLWRGGRNFGPGYGTTSDYNVYMQDRLSCWNWPTCGIHPSCESYIWAAALQNKQNDLCTQRRLRSTRASAITMGSWGPNVSSCEQRRLWSDWADVQADLSLHWAQRSFCWFGCMGVHIKASHAVKRSSHCSAHVVNLLLREKRKSIPNFLSGKNFSKL